MTFLILAAENKCNFYNITITNDDFNPSAPQNGDCYRLNTTYIQENKEKECKELGTSLLEELFTKCDSNNPSVTATTSATVTTGMYKTKKN